MVQRVLLAEDDELLRGQLIDLLTARQFVVESFGGWRRGPRFWFESNL